MSIAQIKQSTTTSLHDTCTSSHTNQVACTAVSMLVKAVSTLVNIYSLHTAFTGIDTVCTSIDTAAQHANRPSPFALQIRLMHMAVHKQCTCDTVASYHYSTVCGVSGYTIDHACTSYDMLVTLHALQCLHDAVAARQLEYKYSHNMVLAHQT
jgi:hypothetical protein